MSQFLSKIVAMLVCVLFFACSVEDSQSTSFGFVHELEQRMATIGDEHEQLIASCMSSSGHFELEEARQLTEDVQPVAHSGMVFWHPLETGPTTMAEAELFGLRGVSLAFQRPLSGSVVGSNRDFARALKSCQKFVEDMISLPITETIKKWVKDYSEIRRYFINRLEPVAYPVLETQLLCFAREAGIAEDVVLLVDRDTMLDGIGVESGRFSRYEPPESPVGEIAVHPRFSVTYLPTPTEIALSKHFVNCAQKNNLVERILEVQQEPRRETLSEFENLLADYRDWAHEAEAVLAVAIRETEFR